jgi:hypothetical protein
MSGRKTGLPLADHRVIALTLARQVDELTDVYCRLGNAYSRSDRAPLRAVERALTALRKLRSTMENACAAEPWHDPRSNKCVEIYSRDPQQARVFPPTAAAAAAAAAPPSPPPAAKPSLRPTTPPEKPSALVIRWPTRPAPMLPDNNDDGGGSAA